MGKVIVVSSGKGGVGKTTTSVNLASALAKKGKEVVLMDANLTTPNIGLHLGLTKFPLTLNDVLKGEAILTDAIYLHPLGFKILPGSLSIRSFSDLNSRNLKKVFQELRDMAEYIVVDSAAGLGNESIAVLRNADEVLLVTNPELPAVTDAFKIVTLAKEIGIPVKGVVLNKVRKDSYDLGTKAIEGLLETPVASIIREDKMMREAVYKKRPILFVKPRSHTSNEYNLLADKVIGGEYVRRLEELEKENAFLKSLMRSIGFRKN